MSILAGDLGGTKTVVALYRPGDTLKRPWRIRTYASAGYDSLETIIGEFLDGVTETPQAASFGIAGPVIGNEAKITNLPWTIRADVLRARFGVPVIQLINDVQAISTVVPRLDAEDIYTLNIGKADPKGAFAVVAPGTGLGIGYLVSVGDQYRAFPTEGGHISFAPSTEEELELLNFLKPRYGHVSFERVCSGSGIPNIYDYLRATGRYEEPEALQDALSTAADPTPLIVTAGLAREVPICVATVDMFVRILGGVLGNVALMVMATGGLYLGGGIPPRILDRLEEPDLLASLSDKGRFRAMCANIPLHVILDPLAALHGAAQNGLQALAADGRSGQTTRLE